MSELCNSGIPGATLKADLLNGKFQNIITVAKTTAPNDGIRANYRSSDYTSDSACIQAALDYISTKGGGTLLIMDGHYICPTQLSYHNNNLIICGNGNNTILDFSSSADDYYLSVSGTYTSIVALLESDANATDLTIKVAAADATKFSADDWIRIKSKKIFQPRAVLGWNQKVGEYQQIASVASDGTITLKEKLFGSYKISDTADITVMTMYKDIVIRDFKVIGLPNTDHFGFNIKRICNVLIDNITFDDCWIAGIYLTDVIGASVTNTTVHRAFRDERGYGLAVQNACRDIAASNNHYFNCRHAITCGGDQTYGIQYNQTYTANTFSYDSMDQAMFGMHPSYDGLVVTGNIVSNGGLGFFNGKNSTIVGNTVHNAGVWAIYLPGSAENTQICDNRIESTLTHCIAIRTEYPGILINNNYITNLDPVSHGISLINQATNVTIENNHIAVVGKGINVSTIDGLADITDLKISGNKIITTGANSGIELDLYNGTRIITKTSIENNTITSPATGSCIKLTRTYDSAEYSKIQIKNNICYGGGDSIDISVAADIEIKGNSVYDATRGLVLHLNNDGYTVDSNEFHDCGTTIQNYAPLNGNVITNNIGYPTKNGGRATIPTGETSIAVTHGLAITPTKILLTPVSSTEGISYYVPNNLRGATTFTITMVSAPSTNVSFDWSAEA